MAHLPLIEWPGHQLAVGAAVLALVAGIVLGTPMALCAVIAAPAYARWAYVHVTHQRLTRVCPGCRRGHGRDWDDCDADSPSGDPCGIRTPTVEALEDMFAAPSAPVREVVPS